jgi:hypothetical protein
MKRSPLPPRTKPLKRSPLKKKIGKKTREWTNARNKLKKEFQHKQIERCELCGSEFGRGFAHRFKRRFITTLQELKTVVLLCNEPCHNRVERMSHKDMKEFLDKLIAGREARYWESC